MTTTKANNDTVAIGSSEASARGHDRTRTRTSTAADKAGASPLGHVDRRGQESVPSRAGTPTPLERLIALIAEIEVARYVEEVRNRRTEDP